MNWVDRVFGYRGEGSGFWREIVAGLTTFAAMGYILVLNPIILSDNGRTGLDPVGLVTVTAVAAAVGCFLMAALTNYPIAQAPGMGINSYFATILVVGMGVPWQGALAMVFWNGVVFFLLSVTGVRSAIIRSLPNCLQVGVQAGIGFFIAFIGLQNAGVVIGHPGTLVQVGFLQTAPALVALGGLLLMGVLVVRRVPGAILLSIGVLTLIGVVLPGSDGKKLTELPQTLVAWPQPMSQTFLGLDWLYPFRNLHHALPILLTLLLLDIFDSLGTLIGLGRQSGLMDQHGRMPKLGRALVADSLATIFGSLLGTSTTTSYVESATGIAAGGRTGLTSVVVGLCFLLALFLAPLVAAIPAAATAPALMIVGFLMARGFAALDFADFSQYGPAILTALMMPFSFSITDGIALGMIFYSALMLFAGRAKEVSIGTWVLAVVFAAFLLI